MISQGAFNLLFRPGLRKDFRDTWDEYGAEYGDYLKTETTDQAEQSATIMTGLNRLYERGDLEPITYVDPKMGPKVMAVDKEFAAGFIVSRKTVEDDQYGKANQGAKWLAHAGRLTYEYRAAGLLDDAFTGTYYKGIDGLQLCHAAHTLINSATTVANTPTVQYALSVTGITAVFDLYQNMVDENGDPIIMFPDTLVIGNSATDLNTALAIWNSQLEPFTPNNTDNVIKRRMPKGNVKVSHYKTSKKSWFMIQQKYNDAHLVVRRAINFDDTFDFETDAAKYKATTRFFVWFVDWRGWVGVNPT